MSRRMPPWFMALDSGARCCCAAIGALALLKRATVLQTQDTVLDAALTVAHAVWHFAGAILWSRPQERALTWSDF